MEYIFRSLLCSNVDNFNNRNLFLTANLLKQGYRYIMKFEKQFQNSTTDTHSQFLNTRPGLNSSATGFYIRTYIVW